MEKSDNRKQEMPPTQESTNKKPEESPDPKSDKPIFCLMYIGIGLIAFA